ncbi:MAG: cytochrome b/b6 domain-containing protein [Pseudomonadota bacterium]|uniref:cytochrome b/b6 domain-containing protein n=1 Tax=Roseovarius TaxID=74030 RepID=UPI0022A88789|nr:cytochrome b/b6 domain-containing protein [Roseovarius sp. EGI FJ00037]MCZ0812927.1 cytochrome b/b6 domain-containing protein [Roseovarius sp. EGI FJ00037]
MPDRAGQETVKVWDPLIRMGHWILVVAFATAYLTEGEPEWLHVRAGYAIAAVVALRILWGLVGPRRARFSDFVTGPARVLRYLRALVAGRAARHLGHSPAGGAMTLALLAALAVTAVSGMVTLATEDGRGPLAGIVAQAGDEHGREHEGEADWEEIHETAANLTVVLIVLHLGGVALASHAHGENLSRAMVTGRKRA